jgi:hypothetical protein
VLLCLNRAGVVVFEGGAVPFAVDGGGFVGALAEREDGSFGVGGLSARRRRTTGIRLVARYEMLLLAELCFL